jgi:hypothetical protein
MLKYEEAIKVNNFRQFYRMKNGSPVLKNQHHVIDTSVDLENFSDEKSRKGLSWVLIPTFDECAKMMEVK